MHKLKQWLRELLRDFLGLERDFAVLQAEYFTRISAQKQAHTAAIEFRMSLMAETALREELARELSKHRDGLISTKHQMALLKSCVHSIELKVKSHAALLEVKQVQPTPPAKRHNVINLNTHNFGNVIQR